MIPFDLIRSKVSARAAAEHYGLKFGRNGRALCPWHDDHRPDLKFYDRTASCYCFACGAGGDAVALTAQLFGLSMKDAAAKICADFDLHLDMQAPRAVGPSIAEQRREKQKAERERWSFLCDVIREADELLARATPETISPDFDEIIAARARADIELCQIWDSGQE